MATGCWVHCQLHTIHQAVSPASAAADLLRHLRLRCVVHRPVHLLSRSAHTCRPAALVMHFHTHHWLVATCVHALPTTDRRHHLLAVESRLMSRLRRYEQYASWLSFTVEWCLQLTSCTRCRALHSQSMLVWQPFWNIHIQTSILVFGLILFQYLQGIRSVLYTACVLIAIDALQFFSYHCDNSNNNNKTCVRLSVYVCGSFEAGRLWIC